MKKFMDYNAAKLAYDAANTLAYLLTSNYDLRLTQGMAPEDSSSIRCGSMRVFGAGGVARPFARGEG